MARPRFSEMLHDRRLEMGVSTAQASHVLRLKEQVLIAFEEGDFDNIPKSGYAQGMLSSYARYLGLNPAAVTDQFTRDLADWEMGTSPRGSRGETRRTYPQANSGARGLLPTSGGYAGDMAGFSTVSRAHTRSGSLPLVDAQQARDHVSARDDAGAYTDPYGRGYRGENRPYTTRQPRNGAPNGRVVRAQDRRAQGRDQVRFNDYDDTGTGRPQVRQRNGYKPRVPVEGDEIDRPRTRGMVRSERDRVTTRRVSTDYVDDLRYDDRADPYEAASTRTGRVSSRNIAAPARPNVRRQQGGRTRSDLRRRENPPARKGILGTIDALFSDNRRATFVVLAVLAILIMVIVISSIGSCVSNAMSNGRTTNVPVSQTQTEGSAASSTQSYTPTVTEGSAAIDTTTDSTTTTPDKVEVTVAVADGGISWIEITLDGESKVAETKTGPWSETYTVTDNIKIEASDPSVVTVTENGEKKTFDKKASGVGTITIQGVPVSDSSTDSSTDTTTSTTTTQHQAGDVNANGDAWDPDWNMWYSDTNGDHYDDAGNHYTSYAEAMAAQQSSSSTSSNSSNSSSSSSSSSSSQ